MIKPSTIYLIALLSIIAVPATSFASELSGNTGNTATIRLNINTLEVQQSKQSFWRRALKYIGIRSGAVKYPAPGTGITVHSSAYAPSPYQTDSTPCITAAGTRVRPGVVAANFLPFGTLLQIGNEVYIVEDRMNPRFQNSIDIFFPSTSEALDFGRQELNVIIIGYGKPGQRLPREEPKETEEQEVIIKEKQAPPTFREKLISRLGRWQQVAGELIGIRSNNVNQYDVDCFSSP